MTSKEIFIALTCNNRLKRADAVILLEGDGFNRIKKACSLVREGWADILVFSGGVESLSYGSYSFEMCIDKILKEGLSADQIIHEKISLHTRQQAEEIIKLCVEKSWKKIILVATHYHQYRSFLTFLKVLEEQKLDRAIEIINAPATEVNWFEQVDWGIRFDILQKEFEKIETYKCSGHISDYKTAIEYYKWSMCQ